MEDHRKLPSWDSQLDIPGISWIALLVAIHPCQNMTHWTSRFWHFFWEYFWDPQLVFSVEDGVDICWAAMMKSAREFKRVVVFLEMQQMVATLIVTFSLAPFPFFHLGEDQPNSRVWKRASAYKHPTHPKAKVSFAGAIWKRPWQSLWMIHALRSSAGTCSFVRSYGLKTISPEFRQSAPSKVTCA